MTHVTSRGEEGRPGAQARNANKSTRGHFRPTLFSLCLLKMLRVVSQKPGNVRPVNHCLATQLAGSGTKDVLVAELEICPPDLQCHRQ